MFRFPHKDVVGKKTGKSLIDIKVNDTGNHLPDKGVEIGEEGKRQLSKMPKELHKSIMKDVKSFYSVVAEYLRGRLPLVPLHSLQFLHPLLKMSDKGPKAITLVAKKLPHVLGEDEMSSLKKEWLDYSTSEVPREWSEDEQGQYVRVDHYWKNVTDQKTSSGLIKYPTLSTVVKSALT